MKEINAEELKGNLIEMINKKWALVTAGDHEKANTMTVSWGSFGEFWSKPVISAHRDIQSSLSMNRRNFPFVCFRKSTERH